MALSVSQLEQTDIAAGWPAAVVPEAAAIEEAESGGNVSAIGPGGSWGTFQIQPQYHQGMSQTTDALTQAKDALAIYQAAGNSFSPWSTYPGAAAGFLGAAEAAMAGVDTSGAASSSADQAASSSGTTGSWGGLQASLGLLGGGLADEGLVVLGGLVLAGGLLLAFWQTPTGKRMVAGAKHVAGDAVKVAVMVPK